MIDKRIVTFPKGMGDELVDEALRIYETQPSIFEQETVDFKEVLGLALKNIINSYSIIESVKTVEEVQQDELNAIIIEPVVDTTVVDETTVVVTDGEIIL